MTRTPVFHEELAPGSYRILLSGTHKNNNVLVVMRGTLMNLILIPLSILTVEEGHSVLEIKEGGGFRVPASRVPENEEELSAIDAYQPPGGTPR